jgi:hypothetical protein
MVVARHHFDKLQECAVEVVAREGRCTGSVTMATRIFLNDLLLFSCLATLVTGIVLAAARLLI